MWWQCASRQCVCPAWCTSSSARPPALCEARASVGNYAAGDARGTHKGEPPTRFQEVLLARGACEDHGRQRTHACSVSEVPGAGSGES